MAALKIEKVFAHVVEMPVGFTYSCGKKLDVVRAIVWEIVAGPYVGLGENVCPLETRSVLTAGGSSPEPGKNPETTSKNLTAPAPDARVFVNYAGARLNKDQSMLTPDDCAVLRNPISTFVAGLLGRSPLSLEALLPEMPQKRNQEFLVLREGLSIALYDLAGKACGVPVHVLLGGKRRDSSPGMPVIHTAPADVMIKRCKAWVTAGYRYLKIKPPGSLNDDLDVLRRIRQAVGPDISIQVDWNQTCKEMETAERAVRGMKAAGVDVFEDVLDGSLEQIAELRRRTGARIMVDHEAFWPQIYEVCKIGAADIINHHPNNQGGLATALQIDAVAAAAGIPSAIGSSGRFAVQNSAFQMLSSVIGLSRPCEDIGLIPYYSGPTKDEYAFDREPSVIRKPYPIVNGVIHIPDDPGLGIELDQKRLKACTIDTICFE